MKSKPWCVCSRGMWRMHARALNNYSSTELDSGSFNWNTLQVENATTFLNVPINYGVMIIIIIINTIII